MTHRKMPSTTSQKFKIASYEKKKRQSVRSQFPEAALKLYAQYSLFATIISRKLAILIDEILGEWKRYWIGKQWFMRELMHLYWSTCLRLWGVRCCPFEWRDACPERDIGDFISPLSLSTDHALVLTDRGTP